MLHASQRNVPESLNVARCRSIKVCDIPTSEQIDHLCRLGVGSVKEITTFAIPIFDSIKVVFIELTIA